ncbi:hypothetical protein AB0758_32920 [Tolypothrix bouteillei VB521301_2]|uniref:Uncharacterized protein n=1 Tax=Tolypothrix bouteillei VB521301 TaxID=1479485 RepID=A0A0C1RPB4_9CYAN|nr:hypothetical protein [Tolypothrix bouteillei]KAF3884098.1 hypothetical protein DA73_0400000215 [Tolypothrix bouteillei VB521301]
MNELNSVDLVNQLLRKDASDVLAWLKDIGSGQLKAPKDFNWFNWLGLAEGAATHAHIDFDDGDTTSSLSWAEAATLAYDILVSKSEPDQQESHILSLMVLRAAMIERFDAIPGHPVLDVDRIIHWFFDNLTMSLQEAQTKALSCWEDVKNSRENSIENLRELKKIKINLRVLLRLVERGKILPNEELKTWISLETKLP